MSSPCCHFGLPCSPWSVQRLEILDSTASEYRRTMGTGQGEKAVKEEEEHTVPGEQSKGYLVIGSPSSSV